MNIATETVPFTEIVVVPKHFGQRFRVDELKDRTDARITGTLTRWAERWARRHGKGIAHLRWRYDRDLERLAWFIWLRFDVFDVPDGITRQQIADALEGSSRYHVRFMRIEPVKWVAK